MKRVERLAFGAGVAATLALGLVTPGPGSAASEFYSWIAPSGEIVLTDDAGSIPPVGRRGPVSVHRYQDVPGLPVAKAPAPLVADSAPAHVPDWDTDFPDAVESAVVETADVLAESQEVGFATQYGWGSLPVGPTVGWSAPLYGFWSGRSIQNQLLLLQAHLKKLHRGPVSSHRAAGLHRPMRERQAPVGTLRAGGAPAPCCPGQPHPVSGRRSGFRR